MKAQPLSTEAVVLDAPVAKFPLVDVMLPATAGVDQH